MPSPDDHASQPADDDAERPQPPSGASGDAWRDAVDPVSPSGAQGLPPEVAQLLSMLSGMGLGLPGTAGAQSGGGVDPAMLERMLAELRSVMGGREVPEEVRQMMGAILSGGSHPMAGLFQQQMSTFLQDSADPAKRTGTATDLARKVTAARGDRSVSDAERQAVDQAVGVARLWLDPVTSLGAPSGAVQAWSSAEWVEATMPRWMSLVEPVAEGVSAAGQQAIRSQLERFGGPAGLAGLLGREGRPEGMPDLTTLLGLPAGSDPSVAFGSLIGHLEPMLRQVTTAMFTAQIGQAVGGLSTDVLSGTEVGLPLVAEGAVVLLPARVAAFADDVSLDVEQVRLYLAVREAARARLFEAVPWLGGRVESAVRDYGRHISIDTEAIEEAIRSVEMTGEMPDLAQIQEAFGRADLFARKHTPEQEAALTRLEATLALIEGWVDLVTEQAVAAYLPQAEALGEAVRRRRIGGPAQKTFAGLVGLELTPRRLRDARNLFAALENAGGIALRDSAWDYPDLAPSAADLDDPLGYVERRQAPAQQDDMDAELRRLLEGHGDSPGASPKDAQ